MKVNNTLSGQAEWMKLGMRAYLFPGYKMFRRKVMELSDITPESAVLDFGCGIGLLEEYIKSHIEFSSGKITGVDSGREVIEIAKNNFSAEKSYEFIHIEECCRLPFEDDSFTIIISNLVFHLLNREQKISVLKEFRRIIKPKGHILLAEIGKPDRLLGRWIKFLTLNLWIKIWPYEVNSIDSFNGLLPDYIKSAGFTRIKTVFRMKGYIDFISAVKEYE